MNAKQIDRFFKIFSHELGEDATVILTGAGAGALWGRIRPSFDVDFEVTLRRKNPALWSTVERAAAIASQTTGIQANFANNIDRWGMISLLDYRKHRVAYKHFGPLKLELMDPIYWSIGKMTRYLSPDVEDIVEVFRRRHVAWSKAVAVWGKALKKSPKSTALHLFRHQVEHFIRHHGSRVWGKMFPTEEAIQAFHQASLGKSKT
jgi:hypothetical protein